LVRRCKAAAPGVEIVVWDFEEPEKTVLAFIITILKLADWQLIEAAEKQIVKVLEKPGNQLIAQETLQVSAERREKMDRQYDHDLDIISEMDDVSLISSEDVPEEYHL
jgi:hypothetical protein